MTFESYAKGREFQTITLPTPTMQTGIINRFLENKRFTQGQADASFKLRQEFAKIHLQHGIESARVVSDNLRTNQWLLDKNQTLIQKQELHNYKTAIDDAKRANPQSREALTDKFGSLLELVPKFAGQIAAIKKKENEADYKKGINLINRVRATSSQIAELQAVKGELWDEDKNYIQAAQVLKSQGATDDDLYAIRNSSGWVHFGMIEAGLGNLAPQFHQHILNNIDTPYPIGEKTLSYSQAKSSGNIGAVQNILSQMQAEFGAASFRQLGIETPNEALATGFFEKLDKISDARYNDALRTSLSQADTVNNDTRRMQVFNALNEDGIKTYFSQFINGYEDPNNKNWRRNAIATSFDDVVAYYKQDNVNISNIQEALEATRPDGTPLLGNINKGKLEGVIAEKQEKALEISRQGLKRRKQAIEQAKMQILADLQGQDLNPQGMFELQRMYKDVPEIHQWISTLITPQVTDEENRQNSAELEYKASQGLLTTEMVLQSNINQATKFKFLGDKRLDNPYPDQKKEYETLISGELKSILKINSWQDVSNHEHSLRAASAHIHEKTMDRFTSLMRNGNMDATTAFNEALAYGRAEIAALKIIPYKLGDPNSGYIEGYRVDANGAPLSRTSAIIRRQQFAKDPNFINVTPLDTKQDYEYLQQKLASGSVLTPDILNDKFPWVRDIVDLYGGHLTAQEVLEANAKTVGVNLAFPTTIEPSNLSPALARQNRLLANNLGQLPAQIINSQEAQRLRMITPPPSNRPYQVTSDDTNSILNMAAQLNLDPKGLAALLHLESGLNPNNWGGDGGKYVGIIQFGEGARSETGLPATKAQWKDMTLAEQVPYAIQYLRGRGLTADRLTADPWHNLSLVYMTILNGNPDSDPTFQDSNGMSVDKAMRDYFRPGTRTYNEAQQIMGWGN